MAIIATSCADNMPHPPIGAPPLIGSTSGNVITTLRPRFNPVAEALRKREGSRRQPLAVPRLKSSA